MPRDLDYARPELRRRHVSRLCIAALVIVGLIPYELMLVLFALAKGHIREPGAEALSTVAFVGAPTLSVVLATAGVIRSLKKGYGFLSVSLGVFALGVSLCAMLIYVLAQL